MSLLHDEIYHILFFSDHREIIHKFSLINKEWFEISRNIPLSVSLRRNFSHDEHFTCPYKIVNLLVKHAIHRESLQKVGGLFQQLKVLKLRIDMDEETLEYILEHLGNNLRLLEMHLVKVNTLRFPDEKFTKLEGLTWMGTSSTTFEISKLESLKYLDIFCGGIDLSRACLPNLTRFSTNMMRLTSDFLKRILQISIIENLQVDDCVSDKNALGVLSDYGSHLLRLNYSQNLFSLPALKSFCYSSVTTNLRELLLDYCSIEIEGCEYIGNGPALANLTYLSLKYCKIGPEGFEKIVKGPNSSNLKSLFVEDCDLGVQGCKAIVESKTLTNLEYLEISSNEITQEGCELLSNTPNLKHLSYFLLADNDLESNDPITNSPYLTELSYVDWE